jgi:hypothetical protein
MERVFFVGKTFWKAHALCEEGLPGTNPTIVSYNASVVKIYNATNSIARFQNENHFFQV